MTGPIDHSTIASYLTCSPVQCIRFAWWRRGVGGLITKRALLVCRTVAVLGPVLLAAAPAARAAATLAGDAPAWCEAAIQRAEHQYGLPAGMLGAIGRAESGRLDPAIQRTRPWPWAVQANNQGLYFNTKAEAIAWVRKTLASGQPSIDTGCLQINLLHHPQAFATLDAAFDPDANADYAARFLLKLHGETNDWSQAIAFYHSRTPALGVAYQRLVQFNLGGAFPGKQSKRAPVAPQDQTTVNLAAAWQATLPHDPPRAMPAGGQSWSSLLRRPAGSR